MIILATSLPSAENKNVGPEFLTNDLDRLMSLISENLELNFFRQMQLCAHCDQFNADLIDSICDFVSHDSCSGDTFLSKLKELNFFLIPTSSEGNWHRFHHLFGDILKRQLKITEPEIITPLYHHISTWYSGKGLIDEAIKYAIKAENFEMACDLIGEYRMSYIEEGQWWVVQRWLESIPLNVRHNNVDLLLTELLVCEETWNLDDFSSILDTLESIGIENSTSMNHSRYLFHRGYFLTYVKQDPKKAVEYLERSKALWHDLSGMFGGRRELILATSRQMLGQEALALKALDDIQEEFEHTSKMHLRALHAKLFVYLLSGNFTSASNEATNFLFLVQNLNFQFVRPWSWYFHGNINFQSFERSNVVESLEQTLTFWGKLNYRVYFDALAGLILFKSLDGDNEAAGKLIIEMKEKVEKLKDTRFIIYYKSIKARADLLNGKGEQALAWAQTNWVKQDPPSYFFLMDVPDLTKIRIIVSHGSVFQVEEALIVLSEVKTSLTSFHNDYHVIDLELLQAMAMHRIGRKKDAKESFEKALLLAEKKDTIRPVIEAFQVMPSLFRSAMDANISAHRILSRISLNGLDTIEPLVSSITEDSLSIREEEIVRLIADGLRSKEIADSLNISILTVKSHLTNIYRKLEVPNRTSMIKKARNRQII